MQHQQSHRKLRLQYLRLLLILLVVIVCCITTSVGAAHEQSPVFTNQVNQAQLLVHFINVGQGDSILLQSPDGTTALIDGGNPNGLALAYLQEQGVTKIDVMIAT